jgi:protein-disulfide isomerase
MFKKSATVTAMAFTLALFASACSDPQEISDIKSAIQEMQAQQKDLLDKVDKLGKGQKEILAKAAAPAPAAAPARPAEDPNKVYEITIGDSYSKGPEDAPVTIVEWSDFQCPFCSQAAALVKQIREAYPNEVRFVYKNYPLPFHKEAMPAAKAAIAAGKQGKFFEMHDKLFENYRALSNDKFIEWAGELGLDVEKFKTDMASAEVQALVTEEMKQAGSVGVRGTPTFFINGKKPAGRSFELYKSIIDEEITKKKG